jgi:hypothetical protein
MICEQKINIFNNYINENQGLNLSPNNIQLKFYISDHLPILIDKKYIILRRDKTIIDKIIYKSTDNKINICIDNFNLKCKTINTFDIKKYLENYIITLDKKKYNSQEKRIIKIENEKIKINNIKNKILTGIIFNLNFNKAQNQSHFRNIKNKLINKKNKPLTIGLYDLHIISEISFNQLKNNFFNKLNISLNFTYNEINNSNNKEKLYIYYCLIKIIDNIDMYLNYLNQSIENISKNKIYLNKKIFGFNDILKERIDDTVTTKHFIKQYTFRDYNTYSLDISDYNNNNISICNGYILALSKNAKWNLFPLTNDIKNKISDKQIDNFLNLIDCYNYNNIDIIN